MEHLASSDRWRAVCAVGVFSGPDRSESPTISHPPALLAAKWLQSPPSTALGSRTKKNYQQTHSWVTMGKCSTGLDASRPSVERTGDDPLRVEVVSSSDASHSIPKAPSLPAAARLRRSIAAVSGNVAGDSRRRRRPVCRFAFHARRRRSPTAQSEEGPAKSSSWPIARRCPHRSAACRSSVVPSCSSIPSAMKSLVSALSPKLRNNCPESTSRIPRGTNFASGCRS